MSVLAGGLVLALEQGWLRTLWDSFRPRGLHQFPSFHWGRVVVVVMTHTQCCHPPPPTLSLPNLLTLFFLVGLSSDTTSCRKPSLLHP